MLMLQAAPLPPLPKTQGRGTHGLETGTKNTKDGPPALLRNAQGRGTLSCGATHKVSEVWASRHSAMTLIRRICSITNARARLEG